MWVQQRLHLPGHGEAGIGGVNFHCFRMEPFHDLCVASLSGEELLKRQWVMETFVERSEIEVLRVRADMKGSGPAGAMRLLESKLPSLKGRKFYGVFRLLPDGEEYFACVERIATDNPEKMALETARLPGGLYARQKLYDWEKIIAAGKLPECEREFVRGHDIDRGRPELEYYRSMSEMHFLLPVLSRNTSKTL
jgi:hypothetical protein